MKILFLTQYFPPEIGAPQNRLYELATRLQNKGAEVTILTAMPNYPGMVLVDKYKGKFYCVENLNSLTVHRAYIFVKKSRSLFVRLLNYFSFVFTSIIIGVSKIDKQDYIFCESPPLFLGKTIYWLKNGIDTKLFENVNNHHWRIENGFSRNDFLVLYAGILGYAQGLD